MSKFIELKKEIEEMLKKSPLEFDLGHAQKTLEWVLKLKPDADTALKIAALAHDIDRAVTGITETYDLKDLSNIDEFKRKHAQRSANIITELLIKYSYEKEIIDKVKKLVKDHEVGGDEETNILMDADSIAYFDYHVTSYYQKNGFQKTKDKINFMFCRISDEAKGIIRNLEYKNSDLNELIEEIFTKK